MPRKRPDLKQRLDELREQPAPPVEVKLQLDAQLHNDLKTLAAQSHKSLETYIIRILTKQVEITGRNEVE